MIALAARLLVLKAAKLEAVYRGSDGESQVSPIDFVRAIPWAWPGWIFVQGRRFKTRRARQSPPAGGGALLRETIFIELRGHPPESRQHNSHSVLVSKETRQIVLKIRPRKHNFELFANVLLQRIRGHPQFLDQ